MALANQAPGLEKRLLTQDSAERMKTMRKWQRNLGKWSLRGLALLLLLAALDVTALAYPYPLFAHKQQFDECTIYSNRPLSAQTEGVLEGVRARVNAMEYARPGEGCRVFICGDQRRYSFFAFLTRRSPASMGICVSLLGNMYLNEPRIQRMAARNVRGIRHSRFEGNLAEVISHEIAHFNVVKELGFWRAKRLPVWKSEGYAEYQANLAATREDDEYVFTDRIELLLDDTYWGSGRSMARSLFESHLLVEFLAEEKGLGLRDLVDEAVTEEFARDEMMDWYEEQIAGK
jgi:hypothetical protein